MPPVLQEGLTKVGIRYGSGAVDTILQHIHGGTSADWISSWFKRVGSPVSATTIRTYRKATQRESVRT